MDTKTTCLGVLALGEASGYEIRKAFEEGPFSHFADGGFGSIYPALNKLTDEGLVTCTAQHQEKRPSKKVYRLTEAGWDRLEQEMRARIPGEDKYRSDLLFILFFADWQAPEWIARVIDARIDFYRDKLEAMKDCSSMDGLMVGQRLVHGFGCAVYQAALDYLVEHRDAFVAAAGKCHNCRQTAAE